MENIWSRYLVESLGGGLYPSLGQKHSCMFHPLLTYFGHIVFADLKVTKIHLQTAEVSNLKSIPSHFQVFRSVGILLR